jgi:hypothetical protein
VLALALALLGRPAGSARAQANCQFVLGFATLRNLIGAQTVGVCLENQRSAANGNAEQKTIGGLLVWRKADNWTAFTDGYRTWINGPLGLQQRLNVERFPWEVNGPVVPVSMLLPAAELGAGYREIDALTNTSGSLAQDDTGRLIESTQYTVVDDSAFGPLVYQTIFRSQGFGYCLPDDEIAWQDVTKTPTGATCVGRFQQPRTFYGKPVDTVALAVTSKDGYAVLVSLLGRQQDYYTAPTAQRAGQIAGQIRLRIPG